MRLKITNRKQADIQPGMMGLFYEDINYSCDGGLYAEMIENRSFEFFKTTGKYDAYAPEYDGGYGWTKYPADCPFIAMEYRTEHPLTEENPHYLHVHSVCPDCGFTNKAYDGIYLTKGETYHISLYMNSHSYAGNVKLLIEKEGDIYMQHVIEIDKSAHGWKKYEFSLTAKTTVDAAAFHIVLTHAGEIDFDFISMIPENAVYGVFRKDLADLLKDIHPGFLRFPGGCIIEGNTLANRYQWKKSVGPVTKRKANWNRWATHNANEQNNFTSPFSHYNQTLGIGYYEYFLLCEYIGAKAVPVLNVGLACQYQSTELVSVDDPAFQEYLQDALDLIEFANGDISTTWGALRAEMGHPEPFHLEFLGIGNEQWETERVDFFHRYTIFEEQIHAKYPDIKLIGSAGPDVHTERYNAAWSFYKEAAKANSNFTYAVDEHYYMAPEWFLANTHFYDNYPREVKVFSGEYAAHPNRNGGIKSANTLEGALAEAAFLTGVKRNADVVYMASYAPLFARINYTQWAPDMIWFDAKTAYATPSYYVQKMFAGNMGSYTLAAETEENLEEKKLFVISSYDEETKELIVKVVNAASEAAVLELSTDYNITEGTATVLSGPDLYAYNTIEEPDKVTTHTYAISKEDVARLTLPAHTFTVYRFSVKH